MQALDRLRLSLEALFFRRTLGMLTAAGVSPGEKFTHWTYGYTGAGGALRRLPQHLGDHGVC